MRFFLTFFFLFIFLFCVILDSQISDNLIYLNEIFFSSGNKNKENVKKGDRKTPNEKYSTTKIKRHKFEMVDF